MAKRPQNKRPQATNKNFVDRHFAEIIDKGHMVAFLSPKKGNYFHNWAYGTLNAKREAYANNGTDFCLVVAGDPETPSDFYAIPWSAVRHLYTDELLQWRTYDKGITWHEWRWVGHIGNHELQVTKPQVASVNCNVADYHGARWLLGLEQKVRFPRDTKQITSLTFEQAEAFVDQLDGRAGDLVELNGLTALPTDTAEELAGINSPLSLKGLTDLSLEAAKALATNEHGLCLDGLSTISDEVAEALSRARGFLYLNGLATLSANAAQWLSRHKGPKLTLNGLKLLSEEAADRLGEYEAILEIDSLESLHSDALAECLLLSKCHQRENLLEVECFNHSGSLDVARQTAWWTLEVGDISADAAAEVAKWRGHLSLPYIDKMSDGVAESLAHHQGPLHLDGVTTLSDNAAKALAMHYGPLSLDGLETLSDTAAEALGLHSRDLDDDWAKFVVTESDEADFETPLVEVWDRVDWPDGCLSLCGLTMLSDNAAKALAHHKGDLYLGRLTEISDAAAAALRGNPRVNFSMKIGRHWPY